MSGEAPARADTPRSDGTLLGGRLIYRQTQAGYRTGIEPVLLAASIPVRPGERVAEGGTGAGAGLLCLAARVPGLVGLGLEIDPGLVEAARGNITANGFAAPGRADGRCRRVARRRAPRSRVRQSALARS